jgi:hypothetical protein
MHLTIFRLATVSIADFDLSRTNTQRFHTDGCSYQWQENQLCSRHCKAEENTEREDSSIRLYGPPPHTHTHAGRPVMGKLAQWYALIIIRQRLQADSASDGCQSIIAVQHCYISFVTTEPTSFWIAQVSNLPETDINHIRWCSGTENEKHYTRHFRFRQHVPPTGRSISTRLHGVTSQKRVVIFIVTAVRNSNVWFPLK